MIQVLNHYFFNNNYFVFFFKEYFLYNIATFVTPYTVRGLFFDDKLKYERL